LRPNSPAANRRESNGCSWLLARRAILRASGSFCLALIEPPKHCVCRTPNASIQNLCASHRRANSAAVTGPILAPSRDRNQAVLSCVGPTTPTRAAQPCALTHTAVVALGGRQSKGRFFVGYAWLPRPTQTRASIGRNSVKKSNSGHEAWPRVSLRLTSTCTATDSSEETVPFSDGGNRPRPDPGCMPAPQRSPGLSSRPNALQPRYRLPCTPRRSPPQRLASTVDNHQVKAIAREQPAAHLLCEVVAWRDRRSPGHITSAHVAHISPTRLQCERKLGLS
jgi:hypothetical protein